MKRVDKPVTITFDEVKTESPLSISGRKVKRVIDFWYYGGRWWLGEKPRSYWLVELSNTKVIEVYREDETGKCMCSRMAD